MKRFKLKWLTIIIPVALILILLIVVMCIPNKRADQKKINYKTYTTKDNKVSFSISDEFTRKDTGEYDLYATKKDKQIIGVFTYNLNEYEEKSSKQILDKQINYFVNTREDMKLFKKENKIEMDDKIITRVEYSGKTADSSNCVYIFSVIDFKGNNNYVVYANEVILEKDYEINIGEMINILKSAKLN